jgi:hypothetical protein
MRIEEFLSSTRERVAQSKGNASTKGQNLRYTLLTHHTHLRSKIN